MDTMKAQRWKVPVLCFWLGLCTQLYAVDRVQVIGLFKDRAVVRIDGQQRVLSVGKKSPEGVTLIKADSRSAVLDINGQSVTFNLDRGMGGQYRKPAAGPEVRVYRNQRGMFMTVGSINGAPVNFLVDTGATTVAMNANMARRLGIDFRVDGDPAVVSTASGYTRAYRVKLDSVKVGAIELLNVDAMVIDGGHPPEVLLGMSFLGQLEMINTDETLILKKKY